MMNFISSFIIATWDEQIQLNPQMSWFDVNILIIVLTGGKTGQQKHEQPQVWIGWRAQLDNTGYVRCVM